MMVVNHPGLAGALGGLLLGLIEYVIATALMRRAVSREIAAGGDLPGLAVARARARTIRRALGGCAFLLLPALGFALGASLGHETGSVP
jgi:hypothetical protein